mgnify:CR=1 FL=1
MALANYIVTLPDGSQGTLDVFYDSILSGDIDITDAGYVLSDGTTIATNGEPYWGVTEDDLISLMSPYLSDVGGGTGVAASRSSRTQGGITDEGGTVLVSDKNSNSHLYKILVIGLLAYIIIKK